MSSVGIKELGAESCMQARKVGKYCIERWTNIVFGFGLFIGFCQFNPWRVTFFHILPIYFMYRIVSEPLKELKWNKLKREYHFVDKMFTPVCMQQESHTNHHKVWNNMKSPLLITTKNPTYFANFPVQSGQDSIWLSFIYFLIRYYNCVPFAGCVFVGPSKTCQPRVKTFEELPLEMHPQKASQVSTLSSLSSTAQNVNCLLTFSWMVNSCQLLEKDSSGVKWSHLFHMMSNSVCSQDNQTDSGMVLASEEFEQIEHKHRGTVSKRLVIQKLKIHITVRNWVTHNSYAASYLVAIFHHDKTQWLSDSSGTFKLYQ